MKICVTAAGPTLDAPVDPSFGRAKHFIIVDPETLEFIALDNPSINAMGGAGVQAAQLVAARRAKAVLTGQAGMNAFRALQQAEIAIYGGVTSGTVREAIAQYQAGTLTLQEAAGPGRQNK